MLGDTDLNPSADTAAALLQTPLRGWSQILEPMVLSATDWCRELDEVGWKPNLHRQSSHLLTFKLSYARQALLACAALGVLLP